MTPSTQRRVFLALLTALVASAFTAASALASGPPIVETKPATQIHGIEAKANGLVNPNGASTKFYFEYGTTTSYGSKTAEAATLITKEYGKTLTGLTPSTTYHYRVVATNTNGTSDGADETFKTTAAALPEFALPPKESFPVHFTGSYTEASWNFVDGSFSCGNGTISGEITSAKTIKNAKVVFRGCKAGEKRCPTGEGEGEGNLTTRALEGTLVYRSKTAKTVGIELKPQSGTSIASFKCQLESDEVRGSLVLPITPVNTLTSEFVVEAHENGEYESESGEKRTAAMEANWPGPSFEALVWRFSSTFVTAITVEVKA